MAWGKQPQLPQQPPREKRYGWCRLYNDFSDHPKWRLVSARAGVHLAFVQAIVIKILTTAAKARPRGFLGNFDMDECAIATGVPVERVARVYRTLMQIGWIEDDHIADWLDRQPDSEDPTAAERQRNRRARMKARRQAQLGVPLKPEERDMLLRYAAGEPPPRPEPKDVDFVPVQPADDTPQAAESARQRNERDARVYLFGAGTTEGYGFASRVVAENFGQKRMSADLTIRRWLTDLGGDAIALATIIASAHREALTDEAFRNVVTQNMQRLMREKAAGPALPFGVTAIKGGKSG